ncbi:MAG: GIY-YIG nuclease family protein [Candidatus Contendobacter sp.]
MNISPLQIVYVLTNPAMPGLVKIGSTTQGEVDIRMRQLFSTGVPVPFDCAFACRVPDAYKVEKAIHDAFGMHRINPTREFFKIEPERVISILKLLHVEEVTEQVEQAIESGATKADLQAAEQVKIARRPRMDFLEIGIPIGSILISTENGAQATVISSKQVSFNEMECSLTHATRKVLGLADDYALQPSPYWTFNGKTVKEIYDSIHTTGDES